MTTVTRAYWPGSKYTLHNGAYLPLERRTIKVPFEADESKLAAAQDAEAERIAAVMGWKIEFANTESLHVDAVISRYYWFADSDKPAAPQYVRRWYTLWMVKHKS